MFDYLLAYSAIGQRVTTPQIHAFIINNKHIDSWYCPFAGVYILKSSRSVHELANIFRGMFNGAEYIITLIYPQFTGGALQSAGWTWLNEPANSSILQALLDQSTGLRG